MAPRGIGVVIAAAAAGSDNVSLSFHALLPEKLGWNLTDAFLYTGPQYS